MNSAREGKDLNNAAEVVLVIHHVKEEALDGEISIIESWLKVEKARAGQEGKVKIKYNGRVFKLVDATLQAPATKLKPLPRPVPQQAGTALRFALQILALETATTIKIRDNPCAIASPACCLPCSATPAQPPNPLPTSC
jgi:hypothetical protein